MFKLTLLFALLACAYAQQKASAVINVGNISGKLNFESVPGGVRITGQVSGLPPGKHGLHIHEDWDPAQGCNSVTGHFNPHDKEHGHPHDHERHAGDLGNLDANAAGVATLDIVDKVITLSGPHSVVNRPITIHEHEDTFENHWNHEDGDHIACGVIRAA